MGLGQQPILNQIDSDIKINGLTIEQEKKMVDGFEKDTRDIIGRWLDNSPFISHSLTLFRKDSEFFFGNKLFGWQSSKPKNLDVPT